MCLDNKEHAIYRICKNDTIGPGSNLPFGFTEQIEIVILLGVTEWHVVYMLWSNFEELKLWTQFLSHAMG